MYGRNWGRIDWEGVDRNLGKLREYVIVVEERLCFKEGVIKMVIRIIKIIIEKVFLNLVIRRFMVFL